jgi:hypothetical protein
LLTRNAWKLMNKRRLQCRNGRSPSRCIFLLLAFFLSNWGGNAQPLSAYGKDFANTVWNAETVWEPGLSAAWSNFVTKPPGFGTGADGYGYHYGVAIADNVNGKFMRTFAFAAVSRRRDHYVPLGNGPPLKRIWNAIQYTVIAAAPTSSSAVFNWSGLPASLASAGLSNLYQPAPQRTWIATVERAGTNTAGYMLGNVWLEFTQKHIQPRPRVRAILKSQ